MRIPNESLLILPRNSNRTAIRQPLVLSSVFGRDVYDFHAFIFASGSNIDNRLFVPLVCEPLVLRSVCKMHNFAREVSVGLQKVSIRRWTERPGKLKAKP